MPRPKTASATPTPTPTCTDAPAPNVGDGIEMLKCAVEFLKNHAGDARDGFGAAPEEFRAAMQAATLSAALAIGTCFGAVVVAQPAA